MTITDCLIQWLKSKDIITSWELVTKGIEEGTAQADRRKREFIEAGFLVKLQPWQLKDTQWEKSKQGVYRVNHVAVEKYFNAKQGRLF